LTAARIGYSLVGAGRKYPRAGAKASPKPISAASATGAQLQSYSLKANYEFLEARSAAGFIDVKL
jgi:hypothetical protein